MQGTGHGRAVELIRIGSKGLQQMHGHQTGLKGMVAMATLALSGPALACEPEMLDFSKDGPLPALIEVGADCSFEDVDYSGFEPEGYVADRLHGAPARDRGNGRIGQRLFNNMCGEFERLLFVDCTTGQATIIDGSYDPALPEDGRGIGVPQLIKYIQPPYGPIEIGPQSTMDGVTKIAKSAGLSVWDVDRILGTGTNPYRSVDDQYDYTCGCKLFYPDSVGAKN